jgi:hypothetical protein
MPNDARMRLIIAVASKITFLLPLSAHDHAQKIAGSPNIAASDMIGGASKGAMLTGISDLHCIDDNEMASRRTAYHPNASTTPLGRAAGTGTAI